MIKRVKKLVKQVLKRCFPRFCRKLGNIKYWLHEQAKYLNRKGRKTLTIYALGSVVLSAKETLFKTRELLEPADFCVAHLKNYYSNQQEKILDFGIDAFCVSKVGNANDLKHPNLVGENSGKVFSCNNVKIGVIHFNCKSEATCLWRIIKDLKRAGAKILILYIAYDVLDFETEKLMRQASKRVNQIVGIDEWHPFRKAGNAERIVSAMGSFNSRHYQSQAEKENIILKMVMRSYKRGVICLERSYIPCCFDEQEGAIRRLSAQDKNDLAARRRLSGYFVRPSEEVRKINLGKLFDILDLQVPKKFEKVLEWPVNRICVYPFEIGRNSVLFLREHDPVVHEKDAETYYNELTEKIYGHMRKGLILAFSPIDLPRDIPYVKVESSLALHRTVCKYIVDLCEFDVKVAVTGSSGKTSAKEMIALVLAEKYRAFKNPGNENLQVKMGPMLRDLSPYYEAYVQEVGGGKIGGASNASKVLEPDIGVITNIGYSHLRWSKTREQLAINKIGIADGIRNNGPLFINLDNDMLQTADVTGRNVITYAIDNPAADYKADNIRTTESGTMFDIVHNGVAVECELNTPGEYNIYNALVGFGVGEYVGISHDKIRNAIASFRPEGIRQTLMNVGGYNLFVDCYNAAPNSMVGAVATLAGMGNNESKRIAVLADMTGLEELSVPLHEKVGQDISQYDIDYLICYGHDAKVIYDSHSNPHVQKFFFEDKEETIEAIRKIAEPGDYILFKGSSKFKLEQDIVDEIWGLNLTTIAHERKRKNLHKAQNLSYRIYPSFAHAYSAPANRKVIYILDRVKGKNVISIEREAFADCVDAISLKLSQNLRNIQSGAFRNCRKLSEVVLPNEMKIIEDCAFENCVELAEVQINEGLIHIGMAAFKGCKQLKSIYIPKCVTYIGSDAFEECKELTIICEKDSYAERYAKENSLKMGYLCTDIPS